MVEKKISPEFSSRSTENFSVTKKQKKYILKTVEKTLEFSKCIQVEKFPVRKCVKYIENGGKKGFSRTQ